MTTGTDTERNEYTAAEARAVVGIVPGIVAPGRPQPLETPDTVIRYPGMQSARETRTCIVAGVMPSADVSAHAFTTRSVRVDNFSNQWLRLGDENDFIEPYQLGVIFNVRGKVSINVVPDIPPYLGAQFAAVVGEFYMMTMYDKPQMRSAGIALSDRPATLHDVQVAGNTTTITPGTVETIEAIGLVYINAGAGNVVVQLVWKNAAGNVIGAYVSAFTQAPGTITYNFLGGVVRDAAAVGNTVNIPIPDPMTIAPGDTLTISPNSGGNAGDSFHLTIHGRKIASLV